MYYTNSLTITMNSNEAANKAIEILRDRLMIGFECDNEYRKNPSAELAELLAVEENQIVLPEEEGCYTPEDAQAIIPELLRSIAETLKAESFTCQNFNSSDYVDTSVEATFNNGILTIETALYPNGDSDEMYVECEACGEAVVIRMEDYKEGETYYCPDCGEEIDVASVYEENKPVVNNMTFCIK